MADVKIRDLNDHLVAFYKQRAAAHGVSLEEELRQALSDHQFQQRLKILADLEQHRAKLHAKYGVMPDSTPGIRAERDGEPDA
ncbi:MAG: hypothetical protein NW203_01010 [Hyphomonadaceae bacterium]|nr:hypothetical protein [Hyphomonadaceae bacterium]